MPITLLKLFADCIAIVDVYHHISLPFVSGNVPAYSIIYVGVANGCLFVMFSISYIPVPVVA